MQDIKTENKIPRGVCVLNQCYGVQKNHQLLRTPEALKITGDVYSNGIICYFDMNYNQYNKFINVFYLVT